MGVTKSTCMSCTFMLIPRYLIFFKSKNVKVMSIFNKLDFNFFAQDVCLTCPFATFIIFYLWIFLPYVPTSSWHRMYITWSNYSWQMDTEDVHQQLLMRSQQDHLSNRSQKLLDDRSYDSPEILNQVDHFLIVVLSLCFCLLDQSHCSLRSCRLRRMGTNNTHPYTLYDQNGKSN